MVTDDRIVFRADFIEGGAKTGVWVGGVDKSNPTLNAIRDTDKCTPIVYNFDCRRTQPIF